MNCVGTAGSIIHPLGPLRCLLLLLSTCGKVCHNERVTAWNAFALASETHGDGRHSSVEQTDTRLYVARHITYSNGMKTAILGGWRTDVGRWRSIGGRLRGVHLLFVRYRWTGRRNKKKNEHKNIHTQQM